MATEDYAREQIEGLRERIQDSDAISEDDQEVLLEFSRQLDLLTSEYGAFRHEKLLRHCTIMAEGVGRLADALESREAAEEIVAWINTERGLKDYAEETNQDFRVAIRVFGKRTLKLDEVPDSLSWIPTETSNSYDPTPDRAKMLEWEEAKEMAEECRNTRDAALIMVAYELGARPFELRDMKVGDIYDMKYGIHVMVDGKTGERPVTLIHSVPYLRKWMADHPGREDPDAWLWCKLGDVERSSYNTWLDYFKKPAERAGIKKPVTPRNFRKSNAYWLAKQGASATLIEDRQGRTRGSKHVARYIARFGPENESKQYASLQGVDVEEDDHKQDAPVVCPRCDRETPPDEAFCVWCDQALEHGAVEEIEREQEAKRRELLRFVKDNPDFLDQVEGMEPIIELFDGDTAVIDRAKQFSEALE